MMFGIVVILVVVILDDFYQGAVMSISMYKASIPQFKKMLNNLLNILNKADAHATTKKITPIALLEARLFPDMFHLTKQIQIVTDQVRLGCGRIAGIELLRMEDNETSFAELAARIEKTIQYLDQIKPEQMDGQEAKEIKFNIGEWKFEFTAEQYLITWIIPNFYFHVTTAYNLLRHGGIEIGKSDFLGNRD
jgi:hypothetical protein